ncbi:MAG: hypothetical protein ABIQ86_13565 [Steroidobacteraceae bacterium]
MVRRTFHCRTDLDVIEHDNSGQEFGGYQAALDRVKGSFPDRVIVMNDTAVKHGMLTRAYVSAFLRQVSLDIECFALGSIDWDRRSLQLRGLRSPRWIRTHFFALDQRALRILDNRLYHPDLDQLVIASSPKDKFFSDEVGQSLQEHIQRYLFSPSPQSWYAAAPLSESNFPTMVRKARAILQEKYLSMMLESADASLWPVYLDRKDRVRAYGEKWIATLRLLVDRLRDSLRSKDR